MDVRGGHGLGDLGEGAGGGRGTLLWRLCGRKVTPGTGRAISRNDCWSLQDRVRAGLWEPQVPNPRAGVALSWVGGTRGALLGAGEGREARPSTLTAQEPAAQRPDSVTGAGQAQEARTELGCRLPGGE